eukprot:5466298-Pleurochrysis_carterae.AAC.3
MQLDASALSVRALSRFTVGSNGHSPHSDRDGACGADALSIKRVACTAPALVPRPLSARPPHEIETRRVPAVFRPSCGCPGAYVRKPAIG